MALEFQEACTPLLRGRGRVPNAPIRDMSPPSVPELSDSEAAEKGSESGMSDSSGCSLQQEPPLNLSSLKHLTSRACLSSG